VALNAVQDAEHFFDRLGIILSPEKPQAARAVLVHEAPEGLVARRNRGKHALIIRALAPLLTPGSISTAPWWWRDRRGSHGAAHRGQINDDMFVFIKLSVYN
jgi:hypothetical protein